MIGIQTRVRGASHAPHGQLPSVFLNGQVVPCGPRFDVGNWGGHWLVRWHDEGVVPCALHGHGPAHQLWPPSRVGRKGWVRQEAERRLHQGLVTCFFNAMLCPSSFSIIDTALDWSYLSFCLSLFCFVYRTMFNVWLWCWSWFIHLNDPFWPNKTTAFILGPLAPRSPGGLAEVHGLLQQEVASHRGLLLWTQTNHCGPPDSGAAAIFHQRLPAGIRFLRFEVR